MLNYGKVTLGGSKSFANLIVIQKVKPMTIGRINPGPLSLSYDVQGQEL
jgi:hypothetical protein